MCVETPASSSQLDGKNVAILNVSLLQACSSVEVTSCNVSVSLILIATL